MFRYEEDRTVYGFNNSEIAISTLYIVHINVFGEYDYKEKADVWVSGDINIDLANKISSSILNGDYNTLKRILSDEKFCEN